MDKEPTQTVELVDYDSPGPDFDPRDASREELQAYGFSHRILEASTIGAALREAFGRARTFTHAVLTATERRRRPVKPINGGPYNDATQIFAGFVADQNADPNFVYYNRIMGRWTVPNVYAPPAPAAAYHASQWVGIDGYHDLVPSRLCQAGTETAITVDAAGTIKRDTYAWFEWLPDYEQRLNLAVSPGDVVWVFLDRVDKTKPLTVHIGNWSSGQFLLPFTPLPMNTSQGLQEIPHGWSAEWFVENPNFGGQTRLLSRFDEIYFDGCAAGGDLAVGGGPSGLIGLSDAIRVTMTNTSHQIMALATYENDFVMKVTWQRSS
ncbi:MAG: G1 family glutamic endopeptidase [Solirubrobacteraceae bacterium]